MNNLFPKPKLSEVRGVHLYLPARENIEAFKRSRIPTISA